MKRLTRSIRPAGASGRAAIIAASKDVLCWLERDNAASALIARGGINLSVVGQAMRHVVPDLDPVHAGFTKMVELLQFGCRGTGLCIVRLSNGDMLLVSCAGVPPGATILPDLSESDLHSAAHYRRLLESGVPSLRLPEGETLWAIAAQLAKASPASDLGTAIDAVVKGLGGVVSSSVARQTLLAMLSVGVFDRSPEGAPLSEQRLTLSWGMSSATAILERLRHAALRKLEPLGNVDETILETLIQLPAAAKKLLDIDRKASSW
ncbi:MAG TPA: hypothetical protein VF701_21260 [Thermoanaerobaculia bacterium]